MINQNQLKMLNFQQIKRQKFQQQTQLIKISKRKNLQEICWMMMMTMILLDLRKIKNQLLYQIIGIIIVITMTHLIFLT